MSSEAGFSHFREDGAGRMVDVGGKEVTHRLARAEAIVRMQPQTLQSIRDRTLAKGDVFEVSRLAGIMAAKRTGELIPLCHPLGLDRVEIDFLIVGETQVRIEALAAVQARTGVEMEALTAVSVAALTLYDMCKSMDRGMTIERVALVEKSGGKSGHYVRAAEQQAGSREPSDPATREESEHHQRPESEP